MDIMKLMKQAQKLKKVQKEISNAIITEETDGVKVSITGAGVVKSFVISRELYDRGKDQVEIAAARAMAACLKKQQDIQKEKAQEAMGGMNLPRMFG